MCLRQIFFERIFQVYCFYIEGSDEEGSDSNDEAEDVLLGEGEEAKEKKPVVLIEQEDPDEKGGKKKKKSRKRAQNNCKNCKEKGHLKKECPQLSEERRKELQDLYTMKVERKGHGTGRKKNKNKKSATEGSNSGGEETPPAKSNSESCENSSSAGKYVRLQQPGKENEPAAGTPPKKDHQKTDRNVHSQKSDKNKRGKKEKKPKMDITGQEVQDDEGLFQVLNDCFCFTHKNLRRFVTVAQNAICRILTNKGKKLLFFLFAGLSCS